MNIKVKQCSHVVIFAFTAIEQNKSNFKNTRKMEHAIARTIALDQQKYCCELLIHVLYGVALLFKMDPPTPLLADDHDDNGDDDQGHRQQPVQLVRVKAGAGDRHSDNLTLCRTTLITCIYNGVLFTYNGTQDKLSLHIVWYMLPELTYNESIN